VQPEPAAMVKYLLVLCVFGGLVWMGAVCVLVIGSDYDPILMLGPSPFLPMFFAVVCALVPLVHTSRVIAVVTFWMTCLSALFGWSFVVYFIRGTTTAFMFTSCSHKDWWCRAETASIAGAAIMVLAMTLLACAIAYYNIRAASAQIFQQQPLAGAGVAAGGDGFGAEGEGLGHGLVHGNRAPSAPQGYGYGYGSYEPIQEEGGGTG